MRDCYQLTRKEPRFGRPCLKANAVCTCSDQSVCMPRLGFSRRSSLFETKVSIYSLGELACSGRTAHARSLAYACTVHVCLKIWFSQGGLNSNLLCVHIPRVSDMDIAVFLSKWILASIPNSYSGPTNVKMSQDSYELTWPRPESANIPFCQPMRCELLKTNLWGQSNSSLREIRTPR